MIWIRPVVSILRLYFVVIFYVKLPPISQRSFRTLLHLIAGRLIIFFSIERGRSKNRFLIYKLFNFLRNVDEFVNSRFDKSFLPLYVFHIKLLSNIIPIINEAVLNP